VVNESPPEDIPMQDNPSDTSRDGFSQFWQGIEPNHGNKIRASFAEPSVDKELLNRLDKIGDNLLGIRDAVQGIWWVMVVSLLLVIILFVVGLFWFITKLL
jgi:ATP-dependent Zn protease